MRVVGGAGNSEMRELRGSLAPRPVPSWEVWSSWRGGGEGWRRGGEGAGRPRGLAASPGLLLLRALRSSAGAARPWPGAGRQTPCGRPVSRR